MSHFTVIVFGEEDIDKALHPFWELDLDEEELKKDERCEFVSYDEEIKKDIETKTFTYVKMPDGTLKSPYDEEFKVNIGGVRYKVPENLEKVEISTKEFIEMKYNGDVEEYIQENYGYQKNPDTGEWGLWENPKAKWDWYQIGGRWRGYFPLKLKASNMIGDGLIVESLEKEVLEELKRETGYSVGEINNLFFLHRENKKKFESIVKNFPVDIQYTMFNAFHSLYVEGSIGEKTWFDRDIIQWETLGYTDRTFKGNIDVDFEKGVYEKMAVDIWKDFKPFITKYSHTQFLPWNEVLKKFDINNDSKRIDEARDFYHKQPLVVALSNNKAIQKKYIWDLSTVLEEIFSYCNVNRKAFIELYRNRALVPFAFILNGEWYEKGEMGWWAIVHNEKSENEWNKFFWKKWNEIPDDTLITLVDCHI